MDKTQRLVLWTSILASLVAFLDGSVVNVALPAISRQFSGSLSVQQWVVDAYLITLGALMLLAGSLSDLYGRKKILLTGLIGFGIASLLCAVAPTAVFLISSRAIQGAAGALLVPSSLALIIAYFDGQARAKAIGSWTAWTGIAFIIGPLVGGAMVDLGSWRLVFAINLVPILVTIWLLSLIPTPSETQAKPTLDIIGAVTGAVGLGAIVFGLIEQSHYGWQHPLIFGSLIIGIVSLAIFLWQEQHTVQPMLPLSLFNVRNFAVGNLATLAVYAGLSLSTFVISIFVQQVGHYSATLAGLALMPVSIMMFLLSSRFGSLSGKFGPRWFMGSGPIVAAVGFITMLAVDTSVNYLILLPGILLLGLGLSITVAPLTSAILSAISESQAGIGSAVNNAVARIAGLLAIAAIGPVIGSQMSLTGFHQSTLVIAGLLTIGGLISAIGIKNMLSG